MMNLKTDICSGGNVAERRSVVDVCLENFEDEMAEENWELKRRLEHLKEAIGHQRCSDNYKTIFQLERSFARDTEEAWKLFVSSLVDLSLDDMQEVQNRSAGKFPLEKALKLVDDKLASNGGLRWRRVIDCLCELEMWKHCRNLVEIFGDVERRSEKCSNDINKDDHDDKHPSAVSVVQSKVPEENDVRNNSASMNNPFRCGGSSPPVGGDHVDASERPHTDHHYSTPGHPYGFECFNHNTVNHCTGTIPRALEWCRGSDPNAGQAVYDNPSSYYSEAPAAANGMSYLQRQDNYPPVSSLNPFIDAASSPFYHAKNSFPPPNFCPPPVTAYAVPCMPLPPGAEHRRNVPAASLPIPNHLPGQRHGAAMDAGAIPRSTPAQQPRPPAPMSMPVSRPQWLVFLTYSHDAEREADVLKARLQQNGIHVITQDLLNLFRQRTTVEQINSMFAEVHFVIPILSRQYLQDIKPVEAQSNENAGAIRYLYVEFINRFHADGSINLKVCAYRSTSLPYASCKTLVPVLQNPLSDMDMVIKVIQASRNVSCGSA